MAAQLDPELMEILACPCDAHAPLRAGTRDDPDADYLTCTSCGRSFPVRDGIPVLLLDEAVPGEAGPSEAGTNESGTNETGTNESWREGG